MKKILLAGSLLSLVSTGAMASQARLLALGMSETDNDGMYHISDARNIFLNPAYANIYNNYVTLEFGGKGKNASVLDTDSATTLDRESTPKAQGGFFKKEGSLVYGLYLGNESNTSSLLRAAGTSAAAAVNGITNPATFAGTDSKMLNSADNQFDLFLAGDNGLKWGANATFARGKDDTRKASDLAIATRWGVIGSNWDAHLNVSLASKAKATDTLTGVIANNVTLTQELKGKLGLQLGGSYVLSGNNRAFGYIKHYGWEQTDSWVGATTASANIGGQTGTVKGDFTSYHLGWGTHYDMNTTDKVYVSVSGKKTDINAKFATKGEIRHLVIPVSLAYEAQAKEWLTLRGSVTQNLWSQRDNKNLKVLNRVAKAIIEDQFGKDGKGTMANSTTIGAGATLTFGSLNIDGVLTHVAQGEADSMGRIAATYNF